MAHPIVSKNKCVHEHNRFGLMSHANSQTSRSALDAPCWGLLRYFELAVSKKYFSWPALSQGSEFAAPGGFASFL